MKEEKKHTANRVSDAAASDAKRSNLMKTLRLSKGLTQSQVAAGASVHLCSYQRWEAGHSFPGVDKLAKIAEMYGVSPAYLAGWITETEDKLIRAFRYATQGNEDFFGLTPERTATG